MTCQMSSTLFVHATGFVVFLRECALANRLSRLRRRRPMSRIVQAPPGSAPTRGSLLREQDMDTMTYDALQPMTLLALILLALTILVLALGALSVAIVQYAQRGARHDLDRCVMRAAELFAARLDEAHRETRTLQRARIDELAAATTEALTDAKERQDLALERVIVELHAISTASETRLKAMKALAEAVLPALAQRDDA